MQTARLSVLWLVWLVPQLAQAQPADDTTLDEDLPPPPVGEESTGADESAQDEGDEEEGTTEDVFDIGEEFQLEARDRVISAARTETTIQEAPAIVTVITAEEMRDRGFRTIIEVLQTIPGFEGDRAEGNGWIVEAFARGNPRTVLILFNGINVIEPIRNMVVLDRKMPLDIIERIEVISGPGGVLWGSNALLGVVNIITKSPRDHEGWTVRVGGGSGPGELAAGEGDVMYSGELLDDVYLLANLNFYTSRGAELTTDSQKFVGVLPEPSPDGITLFLPGEGETDPSRDYFGSLFIDLRSGPLTFNAFVNLEEDHRQLSFGGSILTQDLRSPDVAAAVGPVDTEQVGRDSLWLFSLNYRDRYSQDDVGLSMTGYFVRWDVHEEPFGTFPPSDLLPRGLTSVFEQDGIYRTGINIDADVLLPENNHLIFGTEFFADLMNGVRQTFPEDPFDASNTNTFTDTLVNPVDRFGGGVYVNDEWRASEVIALNAGARLQVSDQFGSAVLLGGAFVWNMFGDTFLKLNYTEGFRPPDMQATDLNPDIQSGLTFQPNPDLDVERARSIEAELNTVLMEDTNAVDRWFLRADYSFSVLDDIIEISAGGFENTGTRLIHSVEVLSRLTFTGQHELSLAYYFVTAEDDELGPLRNVANHIFNAHGRLQIVPDILHFSSDLTVIGPREDANRRVVDDGSGEQIEVFPTDITVEELETVYLLRAGLRAENVADRFAFGVFGYNVLDQRYTQPDPFFDDRVATRSFPMPGWSIYATVEAEF